MRQYNVKPGRITFDPIDVFQMDPDLKTMIKSGGLTAARARDMLRDMMKIRQFEEKIVQLKMGLDPKRPGYNFIGASHLYAGEEAVAVGAISALNPDDYITSNVPNVEESGFDPSVNFPGWQLTGWKPVAEQHEYKIYGETYSQYVFSVDIARIKFNSFLKTFIPVLLTMLIMISSFILNPEQIVTRLSTISSALVASAMFHISIASQIPPVGYLTFADKFMMLTYLILLIAYGLNISSFMLQGRGKKNLVRKLHRWSNRIVFIGVPVLYAALFLLVK